MINLYTAHPTSSFVIYPEDSYSEVPSGSFELNLTQDYDKSTSTVRGLKRLNTLTSNSTSHVVVLEAYSGSGIPPNDGQYTAELQYGNIVRSKWGDTHFQFGSLHKLWSDVSTFSGSTVATDRAYVHGTNLQNITTYTGTDQTGQYTTYNS